MDQSANGLDFNDIKPRKLVDGGERSWLLNAVKADSSEYSTGDQHGLRSVYVYNGGFLTQPRVRKILRAAGYRIRLGWPGAQDLVGLWGQSPTAYRGEAVAARTGAGVLRVEDAFLRSLFPGRGGEPPLGLLLDTDGMHFDPSRPSMLEQMLATHPLDDSALLTRARDGIARIRAAHLTKYSAVDPTLDCPKPGYVLVIDQTRGDAAVVAGGAGPTEFHEMLVCALEENPEARILIKTHPETNDGYRPGYFGPGDCNKRISLCTDPVSPWNLFEGAIGVYTVSSQMGLEAIFAGHKPRVFGQPFYAGWGLSHDQRPVTRRRRRLTRVQLFAASMILAPVWYDPWRECKGSLETALDYLEAAAREWREDRRGWCAVGMRMWKRRPMKQFFGRHNRMIFRDDGDCQGLPRMVWASKAPTGTDDIRVEDGFLRSRGLGAELIPPLSLVCDPVGIYYDPTQPSRLEGLIRDSRKLRPDQIRRAENLIRRLAQSGLSKYNLGGPVADLPAGRRILVPGQVEDDASILTGAGEVSGNLDLLRAVRAANPHAKILYKPHPDVEAGLRTGALRMEELAKLTDVVLENCDPAAVLDQVDEVWTMTSLIGFEALLRGITVTTLGAPFYAGWGLTRDLGAVPARRGVNVPLAGLVHAALIDYPRYRDPVSGLPATVELIADRLEKTEVPHPGPANRILSKMQGVLASQSWLWR